MVKKHYGIRTDRYKLIHFYDDIDEWELYDLQTDPKEMKNLYGVQKYADVQKKLHLELEELQKNYEVTEEEFATTPKAQVKKAYENFARLADEKPDSYEGYQYLKIK